MAKHDGKVTEVDEVTGTIRIEYKVERPKPIGVVTFEKDESLIFQERIENHLPITTAVPYSAVKSYKVGDVVRSKFGYDLKFITITPYNSIDDYPYKNDLTDYRIESLRKEKKIALVTLVPLIYKDSDGVDVFKFGTKLTNVSGSYLKQTLVLNVSVGENIKAGDVIVYNSGFFEPVPYTKQVSWKHGVMANVVLIESDLTYEDSNAISMDMSKRLNMSPAHKRTVRITKDTIVHHMVNIGDHVQTIDPLCTIEDEEIGLLNLSNDPDSIDILNDLNQKKVKAQFSGHIVDMDVFYTADIEEMHPSVQKIVKAINKAKNKVSDKMSDSKKALDFPKTGPIAVGTKFESVEFGENDILIQIFITEDIDCGIGDKIVVGNSLKSVNAGILPKPISTESGVPVDVVFSGRSVNNRIVNHPFIVGGINRLLEREEQLIVDMYFSDKK